jgi:ribosome-associated heat shock protein Hsp15
LIHHAGLRLDKWLWFARLAKSRTAAADLLETSRVRLDGRVVEKPSVQVRPGQVLAFAQGRQVRVIRVEALGERRGPYPEARQLYTDLAPLTEGAAAA